MSHSYYHSSVCGEVIINNCDMNNNNNNNDRLNSLDVNSQSILDGKSLILPLPQKRVSRENKKQLSHSKFGDGAEMSTVLSYNELQRGLKSVLMRLELFREGGGKERRRFLQDEFLRLTNAASEETKRTLSHVLCNPCLTSCVLDVLHFRRRVLCTGFELCLNDLKEWISLATLLEEEDIPQLICEYAKELGPFSKQSVDDIIFLCQSSEKSFCSSLLELKVPGEQSVSFKAGYYNLVLDDLIAMGDEPPEPFLIQSVQTDVTLQIRELHAEWLLKISVALRLQLETFFLAVSIVDRYLSKVPVQRERLHLVGCAALLLASKQEEIYPVSLRALVRYGGDSFTTEMLVSMECQILVLLGFDVVAPTLSSVGMALLLQQDPAPSKRQRCFLMYVLASLAIRTHHRQCSLSALAAAAVYVSRVCFQVPTGQPCAEVAALLPLVKEALGVGCARDVFAGAAYHEVSLLQIPELL